MTTTTTLRPTTTPTTSAIAAEDSPRHAAPAPRPSAAWRTWDWVNLALGLHLILAPLWVPGTSTAWFIGVGVLVIAVALWGLASASSYASALTMSVAAFITYLSGFIGLHSAAPSRWTFWLTGLALFAVTMYATKERQIRR